MTPCNEHDKTGRYLFCDDWQFAKCSLSLTEDEYLSESFSPAVPFQSVDIPHDWLIYQVNDLYEPSLGLYRKTFSIFPENGLTYILRFEGVYFNSTVYINGEKAMEWKYGYSTFDCDMTPYLQDGRNTILVAVHHEAPNSRWYSGAGIFRPVYLYVKNPVHIAMDGVYFSAAACEGGYMARLETQVVYGGSLNDGSIHSLVTAEIPFSSVGVTPMLQYQIYKTGEDSSKSILFSIENENTGEAISLFCPGIEEWSPENPNLYTLETRLYNKENGEMLDASVCQIGFRTLQYTPEGFYLNGIKTKLNGVCLHHDLGSLGAAINKTALRRQLLSMKGMGVNAIRTSHNMPAVELMELCDELGIMVDSEAFDMWQLKKTDYDYARFFDDWFERDVASWVRRDRNHPSIIMWSVGNEIYDTHANPDAPKITAALRDAVLTHDPMKNGYPTIGSNYIPWAGAQACANELKLSGYNYCENLYFEHHKRFPDHIIYGSETAARVQSRNVYHFPITAAAKTCEDLQCSSLENSRMGLSDRTPQSNIIWDRDTPFSCGQFIWTGADYIGEPTPYSTKNAYYGQIDTAGLKKDTYYLYQANWTKKPVLHLFPYWDFNIGQLIDVCAYTNAPSVELFVNGRSMGVQHIDVAHGDRLWATWQVPYEPGEIRAVSYDTDGNVLMTDFRHSFGDTASLQLTPDRISLTADGRDMIFVDITALDEDGYVVENARNRVTVEVTGCARLVGLDSGDSTDYEEYKGISKKLFGGKLVAYIMAKDSTGDIHITVCSEGLPDAALTLKAIPASDGVCAGITCQEENHGGTLYEIPLRKIELTCTSTAADNDILHITDPSGQNLNPLQQLDNAHREVTITAQLLPENTTCRKIEWKATTNSGVETNIAKVTPSSDGLSCVVTALGDGDFRLRCVGYNGKKAPEVMSELEFTVEGMGTATLDPYSFVYGTLFHDSDQTPGEDLGGGISLTMYHYVGFEKVDFGASGTQEFTLPIIHWFTSNPLHVEIWSGIPHTDSAIFLGEGIYQHDFLWQTFFDVTIRTVKSVKGIHDIYFYFRLDEGLEAQHITLKGFFCTPINRAYDMIPATEHIRIYGDSFTVENQMIRHIGNNVSIEFEEMDFTEGFSSITVCGKTANALDSIHIFFMDESGRQRRMIEFAHSEELTEKTFPMEGLKGRFQLTFMFLPGCDFDFAWFRFNR